MGALLWMALSLHPNQGWATLVLDKPLLERAEGANTIAWVQVMSLHSVLAAHAPLRIETHLLVRVGEYWKGQGPEYLKIIQLGGSLGPFRAWVDGAAEWKVGELAVLLLRCQDGQSPPSCRLVAFQEGKIDVQGPVASLKSFRQAGRLQFSLSSLKAALRQGGPLERVAWGQPKASEDARYLPFKMLHTEAFPFEFYVDGRVENPGNIASVDFLTSSESAWETWNKVACAATSTQSLGRTTAAVLNPADAYDDHSVSSVWISSKDDPSYSSVFGTNDVTAVSLMVTYAGVLEQCDIYLNAVDRYFTVSSPPPDNSVDLESVVLHESGHCHGLAHSFSAQEDFSSEVMYPILPYGMTKRSLFPRDETSLCERYPKVGAVGAPCLEDGGCGPDLQCVQPPQAAHGQGTPLCTQGCEVVNPDACPSPLVCQSSSAFSPAFAGACLPPGNFVTHVGQACAHALECGAFNSECVTDSHWLLGYCTQSCEAFDEFSCPINAVCEPVEGKGYKCLQTCRLGLADCRAGYVCRPTGKDLKGVCVPSCHSDADCAGGLCRVCDGVCLEKRDTVTSVGDVCHDDALCGTGQTCLGLKTQDTGVCTQSCGSACTPCPEGSVCHPVGSSGEAACVRDCATAPCPEGLQCGWTAEGRACLPPCQVDFDCPVGFVCDHGTCRYEKEGLGVDAGDPTFGTIPPRDIGCGCRGFNFDGGMGAVVLWGTTWVQRTFRRKAGRLKRL